MKKSELRRYLVEEAEYLKEDVKAMTDYEMFDAWLIYNGIVNYTEDIIDVLSALGIHKEW